MMKRPKRQPAGMNTALTDPAVIGEILGWLEAAGIDAIEIETEGGPFVRIVSGAPAITPDDVRTTAGEPSPARPAPHPVKAPFAGHFIVAHPAGDVVAKEGSAVQADHIVGFVRVGLMLVPARVPESGVLGKCRVETGALVGYGDTLFLVEPVQ